MNSKLRIAGIVKESIVDGPGIRYVIFAQGCKHHCRGCHNPETHSFEGGTLIEVDTILKEVACNPLLDGITLSGGEPFEQAEGFVGLAQEIKKRNLHLMVYTGYTYEELLEKSRSHPSWGGLLELTDILVDGRFVIEKRDLLLVFKGSSNQRIIDMNKTRLTGQLTLVELT